MRTYQSGNRADREAAATSDTLPGKSIAAPAVQLHATPIQREEWDLKVLYDKDSQKSGKANSSSKSVFDTLASKVGSSAVARLGSVHTRLDLVKEALVGRDPVALRKAMEALQRQFESGTPPHTYLATRLLELSRNQEAAMNTMAAYHNLRKTGPGAPAPEAANLAELRGHILAARDAYLAGNYPLANAMLMDNGMAQRHNFTINNFGGQGNKKNYIWFGTIKDLISQAMPRLMKAMAMHTEGSEEVKLPYIIPKKMGESDNYFDYPDLAKLAIPIYLEEWMHKMQKRMREDQGLSEDYLTGGGTGAFWSQNTTDFKTKAEAVAKVGPDYDASNRHMNYNEIDILAAFHDWGFPVEALGTVGGDEPRYQGREQFWDWLHGVDPHS